MQVSLLDEANQEVRELESEQRAAQARLTRLKNQVKDLEKGVGDGGGHGGDGGHGHGGGGGGGKGGNAANTGCKYQILWIMSAVVTFIFRYVFCVVCAMMIHDSKIVPIKKAISVGIGLQVVSAMVRWRLGWRRGEGGV